MDPLKCLQRSVLVLAIIIQISNGLICFTCWRFLCDEEYEHCYEMRHLPAANNNTRELTSRWISSPECPSADEDLRWSSKFMQNCTETENTCGSYYIKITAAVAKNSINETEFPILVTPNYYHSTIVALGCMKVGGETPVVYEPLDNTTAALTGDFNTTRGNMSVYDASSRNFTPPAYSNNSTPSAMSISTTISPVTTVVTDAGNVITKQGLNSTNTTSANTTQVQAYQTASPRPLPTPQPFIDLIIPFLGDSVIAMLEETNLCSPLSHEENRTSYGTLMRINMTGEYAMCDYCRENFCNSKIPTTEDLDKTSTSSEEEEWAQMNSTQITSGSACNHRIEFIVITVFALAVEIRMLRT